MAVTRHAARRADKSSAVALLALYVTADPYELQSLHPDSRRIGRRLSRLLRKSLALGMTR